MNHASHNSKKNCDLLLLKKKIPKKNFLIYLLVLVKWQSTKKNIFDFPRTMGQAQLTINCRR
jgi:hypothetical protein